MPYKDNKAQVVVDGKIKAQPLQNNHVIIHDSSSRNIFKNNQQNDDNSKQSQTVYDQNKSISKQNYLIPNYTSPVELSNNNKKSDLQDHKQRDYANTVLNTEELLRENREAKARILGGKYLGLENKNSSPSYTRSNLIDYNSNNYYKPSNYDALNRNNPTYQYSQGSSSVNPYNNINYNTTGNQRGYYESLKNRTYTDKR